MVLNAQKRPESVKIVQNQLKMLQIPHKHRRNYMIEPRNRLEHWWPPRQTRALTHGRQRGDAKSQGEFKAADSEATDCFFRGFGQFFCHWHWKSAHTISSQMSGLKIIQCLLFSTEIFEKIRKTGTWKTTSDLGTDAETSGWNGNAQSWNPIQCFPHAPWYMSWINSHFSSSLQESRSECTDWGDPTAQKHNRIHRSVRKMARSPGGSSYSGRRGTWLMKLRRSDNMRGKINQCFF